MLKHMAIFPDGQQALSVLTQISVWREDRIFHRHARHWVAGELAVDDWVAGPVFPRRPAYPADADETATDLDMETG